MDTLPNYRQLAAYNANPASMRPAEINKELDRLEKQSYELNQKFIDAGRGYERSSETRANAKAKGATDALATQYVLIHDRLNELRHEIELRYGPGAPSRMPKGFKARDIGKFQAFPTLRHDETR